MIKEGGFGSDKSSSPSTWGVRSHFLRVRHKAVNQFQAVDIGRMFLHAAETVHDGEDPKISRSAG